MIKIEKLVKYYGLFRALNGISFNVEKGEILGLLGPNGAGKTTTLRILTGFLDPTAGNIEVGGYSIQEDPLSVKKLIGYLPESAPLYSEMIVYDFLLFSGRVREMDDNTILKRIDELSIVCGIREVMFKNINELSKGYRQRVGLAYAMIHNPEILILDEPTSGLDPNQIIEIRELIKKIGKEKTVILSTHILSEVEATCDRVVIINNGKIIVDDKPEALSKYSSIEPKILLKVKTEDPNSVIEKFSSINGISDITITDGESIDIPAFIVSLEKSTDPREDIFKKAVENNLILLEMKRETVTLEDVFRQLTKEGKNE